MNRIIEFLDACGQYYLATTDDRQAKVRPMNFARNINGQLSFYTSRRKEVYRQLRHYPHAEIAAVGTDGWMRIRGPITFHTDPALFDHWAAEAEYFRFAPADRIVCSFDHPVIEYMPGYKKPLPEFTANWDLVILPEGEIKYTSSL